MRNYHSELKKVPHKSTFFLLIGITILAAFLYFYKLDSIPNGLNQDETAIGYNAYSILQTGKDEHGQSFPLYFKSFNDYKLPVYIYLTVISIKIFGLNAFAVRFFSALMGVISVFALYFLVKEVSRKTNLALISSFLLTVNPWHMFFSRVAFEVNVGVTFLVLGFLFFYKGIRKPKNVFFPILSLLFFILSLYSYNVTRLMSLLLLSMLILLHRKKILLLPKRILAFFALLLFLGIVPFFATFQNESGFSHQTNVMIFGGDTRAAITEYRSYLVHNSFLAISFNKWFLTLWQYLRNIVGSLSPTFFFLSTGIESGSTGVGNVGAFHLIEFLFILTGIYNCIKKKVSYLYPFILWIVITIFAVSISKDVPHATRSYVIIIPFVIFSAYGISNIYEYIISLKSKVIRYGIATATSLIFFYSVFYFLTSYFVQFPLLYTKWWRAEDKDLVLFLKSQESKYDQIVIDQDIDFVYTSLLFYQQYSPALFQKASVYEPNKLFTKITKVGKYEIRHIDWNKDIYSYNTLFVTADKNALANYPPTKIFVYPIRPITISVEGEIQQYPSHEIAYKIYKSKNGK